MTIQPQIADQPGGILFLSDWPNDESEIKGRPLCGSDGHLFARALRAAGMTDPSQPPADFERWLLPEARRLLWERRAHSFVTLLQEQPDRETRAMLDNASPRKLAAWAGEHVPATARGFIEAAQPNVVVPLGSLSLWALTEHISLDDWRGAPLVGSVPRWPVKVFPTYPPERVLQQYRLFGPLIADLMKVKHESQFPEVRAPSVALWLEPDLGDLETFWRDHVLGSDLITLDIETAVNQIVCCQIGTDARTAICLPFVDYRKSSRSYWGTEKEELIAWDWLRRVLETDTPKLGQNFSAYDAYWLLEKAGLTIKNFRHDLRLIHHILMPELPKSLAFMSALYTSLPRWKSKVTHGTQGSMQDKRDA